MAPTSFASAVSASLQTLVGASQAKSANDVSSVLRNAADSVVKAQFKIGGVSLGAVERKEAREETDAREREGGRERDFNLERDLPFRLLPLGLSSSSTPALFFFFKPPLLLILLFRFSLPPSSAAAICRGTLRPLSCLYFPLRSMDCHSLTRAPLHLLDLQPLPFVSLSLSPSSSSSPPRSPPSSSSWRSPSPCAARPARSTSSTSTCSAPRTA